MGVPSAKVKVASNRLSSMSFEHILIVSERSNPGLVAHTITLESRLSDSVRVTLVANNARSIEQLHKILGQLPSDVIPSVKVFTVANSDASAPTLHAIQVSTQDIIVCSVAESLISGNFLTIIAQELSLEASSFIYPLTVRENPHDSANPMSSLMVAFTNVFGKRIVQLSPSSAELVIPTLILTLTHLGAARFVPSIVVASSAVTPLSTTKREYCDFGFLPELTVVIPTLDAGSIRTQKLLYSLNRFTNEPYQVILVDNGNAPQGFSEPVNTAIRGVNTKFIVVVNDDVEVQEDWWPPLRAALEGGARVAFPRTIELTRSDFSAWCFALTSEAVREFGHNNHSFFDPDLQIWFQDSDLLLKLRAKGVPPVLVANSIISHSFSATLSTTETALSNWISTRIKDDQANFVSRWGTGALADVGFAHDPAIQG